MTLSKVDRLTDDHVEDLHRLYQDAWWAADRDPGDVSRMLEHTDEVVGFRDGDDQLVAFVRVLTDYTYKALLFDVIVAPERRDEGLGERVVTAVLEHPRLADVDHFELYCLPDLLPFYERWGFTDDPGGLRLLRRG